MYECEKTLLQRRLSTLVKIGILRRLITVIVGGVVESEINRLRKKVPF